MIQEKNWYTVVMKISDIYNSIINFVCVSLMCAQTLSIIVMVFGRYIFNKVPQWTEQFALFCMIWFALFSIALVLFLFIMLINATLNFFLKGEKK